MATEQPHVTPVQQRFADSDALGHVNNATLATYVELGRLDFLGQFPGFVDSLILAHLSLDYRQQVRLGQRVEVQTRLVRLGRSSMELKQDILAEGVVAVECRSVVVHFDYASQQSAPLPDHVREVLLGAA
jgi:acyl-CoA thioester hydrolase